MNNITFKQFIYTYNFRYVNNIKQNGDYDNDTCIIRIYPATETNERNRWFEFGIYDFSEDDYKWNICENVLSKEILNSYIESISYNEDYNNVVTIYLTKDKIKN